MTTPAHTVATDSVGDATLVPWDRVERFVGQLTHDVRNGLNALELQLTFLGEISTDPEAIEEVKQIRETLAGITRQLQAIRNSTGAVSLHKLDYPADEFFEDLRERFLRKDPASQDRVTWQVEVGRALLSIDPEMTMAAILELLANALHFSASGSTLSCSACVQGSLASITLRESLPDAPTVSGEHWGRSPLRSTRRGAYGLGLFRVRRIIETQGGSFEVDYAAQEQILTSTLTLPVAGLP